MMASLTALSAARKWAAVLPVAAVCGAVVGLVLGWVLDPGPTCAAVLPMRCLAAGGGLGWPGYLLSAVAMAVATCALYVAALKQQNRTSMLLNHLGTTVALTVGLAALVLEFLLFRSVL